MEASVITCQPIAVEAATERSSSSATVAAELPAAPLATSTQLDPSALTRMSSVCSRRGLEREVAMLRASIANASGFIRDLFDLRDLQFHLHDKASAAHRAAVDAMWPWLRKHTSRWLSFHIVTLGDTCVGFYRVTSPLLGYSEIVSLHVSPVFQRLGIGGIMMHRIRRYVQRLYDGETTLLHMRVASHGAARFCQQLDFSCQHYHRCDGHGAAHYFRLLEVPREPWKSDTPPDHSVDVAAAPSEQLFCPAQWTTQARLDELGDLRFNRTYIAVYNTPQTIRMTVTPPHTTGTIECSFEPDEAGCIEEEMCDAYVVGKLWVFRCTGIRDYKLEGRSAEEDEEHVEEERSEDNNAGDRGVTADVIQDDEQDAAEVERYPDSMQRGSKKQKLIAREAPDE